MIELLLSYNIDSSEALLNAIDEEFVEGKSHRRCDPSFPVPLFVLAVELLLQHEDLKRYHHQQQQQQQQQQQTNSINPDNSRVSCHPISRDGLRGVSSARRITRRKQNGCAGKGRRALA